MADRITGQDNEILIIQDNKPLQNITNVKSFEVTFMFEMKEEGYLGQKSDRFDEFFKGIKGRIELHTANEGVLDLVGAIYSRATTRTTGTRINFKSTLNFPNGARPRLSFNDASFGDVPFNFPARTDYGVFTLDWSCSEFSRIG